MWDYNKLRTFQVVGEVGSISLAAKVLHRTQPAISQQMAILESELGLTLLERRSGRVFLTREGRQLHERTRPLFAHLDESILEAQGKMSEVEGEISVGISSTHCRYFLAPQLHEFSERFPNIRVECRLLEDGEIEGQLIEGKLDFGVLTHFKDRKAFHAEPLFRYEEHPYGNPNYLKAVTGKSKVTLPDLPKLRLIDFSSDLMCLTHWLRKNHPRPGQYLDEMKASFVLKDQDSIKVLVSAGSGVALLPTYLCEPEEKAGTLVRLFPKHKPTTVVTDLAYRRRNNFRRTHQEFIRHLMK